MFELRLHGALEVRTPHAILGAADFGGVKQRHILELLVLHRTLSKTELAELLWEGDPPPEYVATLESYISGLRRRLDPGSPARRSVVLTRTGGYALDDSRVQTDVWRFDALLNAAANLPAADALPYLTEALAIAASPLLQQENALTWVSRARHRLRARYVRAATRAAEHSLAIGDLQLARELSTRATELDALSEAAWRVRMSALDASGDRAGALRCYQTCRRVLSEELGVEPAPATHERFVEILQAGPEPAPQPTGDVSQLVHTLLAAAVELAAAEAAGHPVSPVVQLLTRAERLARTVRLPRGGALQAIA